MVLRHLQTCLLTILLIVIAGTCVTSDSAAANAEDAALGSWSPRGTRRVIYTSDLSNTTSQMSEPAKPQELREIVRNYAQQGSIDTLVQEIWHQGWSTFWRTDQCPYDSRFQHQRLVPMMDAGTMPVEIYIDQCHQENMEFIAGFRMNDRHGNHPDLFLKISQEHPDWILKEFKPTSGAADPRSREIGCSLDYSAAGARDWLFSIMQEVANRFDVDGIEFNFTRMPECFPRDTASQSHAIMTRFVRRVRHMLDEAGQQKGRQLLLGVRVLQHLEGCHKMGLDVPTWIQQKLVNYVAPGDIGFTEFNAPLEEFTQLARAHDCYVYPQVESRLGIARWKQSNRTDFQTPDQYRAVLRNIYGAGADGFSTQNYFILWGPQFSPGTSGFSRPHNYPKLLNTLQILRDPQQVAAGDRHFIFTPLWGPDGQGPGKIYQAERIDLKRAELGQRGEFRFRMCEHLPANSQLEGASLQAGAMLICHPGIVPGDKIEIDINGTPIAAESIQYQWKEDSATPTCRFPLNSPPAVYGDNYLGMKLVKSAPGETNDMVLHDVEVLVKVAK